MDFKQIQDLIKLMSRSDLSELKVEKDNFKITLKKGASTFVPGLATNMEQPPVQAVQAGQPTGGSAEPPQAKTEQSPAKPEGGENNYTTIKSPMIGTFYRSPGPEKEPFVKIGEVVNKGDHICIIEAMKLFNEIESEIDGKIMKVLVEDATPVEYDQPLFLVDPSGA